MVRAVLLLAAVTSVFAGSILKKSHVEESAQAFERRFAKLHQKYALLDRGHAAATKAAQPWEDYADPDKEEFTYGQEDEGPEADDPSDYSVSQFINTDDADDNEDDSSDEDNSQSSDSGDFGQDEPADDA